MTQKILSWNAIKKEVFEAYEPFRVVSKKLRTEIEFINGAFNTDKLLNEMDLYCKKIKGTQEENVFLLNPKTVTVVQDRLRLFTHIANDLDDAERVVLYYFLVKLERETETEIAENRMPTACSRSTINNLKRSAFVKILENFYYNKLMTSDNHKD